MDDGIEVIPARSGRATRLPKGRAVKVINTHGSQVVDTWAYNAADLDEVMSMEATRATILKLRPGVGDSLYTNRRRAILTLEADTTPGIHDTLIAACDNERYGLLGCTGYHDNCADNLTHGLAELGIEKAFTPAPLNLFMNIPWAADGTLSFEAPASAPGQYVVLRAEMDCIVAFSACPQDILPVNGVGSAPVEAHFQIID